MLSLFAAIQKDQMGPFYKQCVRDLKWDEDAKLKKDLAEANKKELQNLEDKIKDAEESLGESEIREALLNKVAKQQQRNLLQFTIILL